MLVRFLAMLIRSRPDRCENSTAYTMPVCSTRQPREGGGGGERGVHTYNGPGHAWLRDTHLTATLRSQQHANYTALGRRQPPPSQPTPPAHLAHTGKLAVAGQHVVCHSPAPRCPTRVTRTCPRQPPGTEPWTRGRSTRSQCHPQWQPRAWTGRGSTHGTRSWHRPHPVSGVGEGEGQGGGQEGETPGA
jgi:hypothetical protein